MIFFIMSNLSKLMDELVRCAVCSTSARMVNIHLARASLPMQVAKLSIGLPLSVIRSGKKRNEVIFLVKSYVFQRSVLMFNLLNIENGKRTGLYIVQLIS